MTDTVNRGQESMLPGRMPGGYELLQPITLHVSEQRGEWMVSGLGVTTYGRDRWVARAAWRWALIDHFERLVAAGDEIEPEQRDQRERLSELLRRATWTWA